jgi:integrase
MARRQSEGVAITQRSDGRFMARVSWTDDAGRSKRTAVYGRSAKEVKEKLKSLRARIDDGLPARDSKVALSVYVEAWVAGALAVSDRKATTKQLYAQLARTHVARSEMGRMPLDRFKAEPHRDVGRDAANRGQGIVDGAAGLHDPARDSRHGRP